MHSSFDKFLPQKTKAGGETSGWLYVCVLNPDKEIPGLIQNENTGEEDLKTSAVVGLYFPWSEMMWKVSCN